MSWKDSATDNAHWIEGPTPKGQVRLQMTSIGTAMQETTVNAIEKKAKSDAAKNPEKLTVALEPAEVTASIARCHFAVSGGNALSLELACVGVPQLVLTQNPRHVVSAQYLDEEGAATYLGSASEVSPA